MLGAATSDIPRTKAIDDLLQRGVAEVEPRKAASPNDLAPRSSGSPSTIKPTTVSGKVWDGQGHYYPIELMFTPKTCKRQRQELICRVEVANKGEKGVQFTLYELS
jgi:hypothetical protein